MAVALDASARAAGLGMSVDYVDKRGSSSLFLPQQLAVIGQGSTAVTYTTTPWRVTTLRECGVRYGIGSQIYLMVKALLPPNGDGVNSIPIMVYPLLDHASGTASSGTITIGGTATAATSIRFRIGGVLTEPFTVPVGVVNATTATAAAIAAIQASLEVPATVSGTTSITVTPRWKGANTNTTNGFKVELVTESLNGVTVVITPQTGGTNNPDVGVATSQIVDRWETILVNGMEHTDATSLNTIQVWGEGRWNPQVLKPAVSLVGCTVSDANTAIAVSDTRKTDRVNCQINSPGSSSLPCVIAARAAARIATVANNNPAKGYTAQKLSQTVAGAESLQWNFTLRDLVKKGGASTVEYVDGEVRLSDVVTMYHPTGEDPPAYAEVVTIIKLQNAIYNYRTPFMAEEWAAAPLVPDDQVTRNPDARSPSAAKGVADMITERLALDAIISDPATVKKNTTCRIGGSNRLDLNVPIFVSGNTFQKAIELTFAFFFGS